MNSIDRYNEMIKVLPDVLAGLQKIKDGEPMDTYELFNMKLKYEQLYTIVK